MKNGKRFKAFVCSLVCCLLLFVCAPSAFAWEEHLYLRDMNRGMCKSLRGQVTVRVVFVNTGISSWTEEEKAAQLGFSLISNHAFVDGNKRIGMYLMISFLELNGVKIDATNEEVAKLGLDVAGGLADSKDILKWIKTHRI